MSFMKVLFIILIVLLVLVFLYLAIGISITAIINNKLFGVRGKDPSHPCYVHFEDYPFLSRFSYETKFEDAMIRGYVYQESGRSSFKGFVILSHGLFGSHVQYLVDVAYLAKAGYRILCFDQYGVGLSGGDSQVSLYHGIPVLDAVIKDVEKRRLNDDLPLILYGHSWGAYCSLGVLGMHPEIQKAVLRSGPVSPVKAALGLLYMKSKVLYWFMKPGLGLFMLLLFGRKSLTRSTKGISKNKSTEILVVYAKNDPMVRYGNSQYAYFSRKDRAKLCLTKKGLHNSIITEESYASFINLHKEYHRIEKMEDENEKARSEKAFYASMDRAGLVEYSSVKDEILKFLG